MSNGNNQKPSGYDPDFIGIAKGVPMPTFAPSMEDFILKKTELRSDVYADYIHYSAIMRKDTKQPILVASNIFQKQHISTERKTKWEIDSRVGSENQLNNDHYTQNIYDKGHMAQRDNCSWGDSKREAQKASDATFYYTNACFQHGYMNRDEWLELEKWAGRLSLDTNDRICVFTSPVHSEFDRHYARPWHEDVRIPTGFFKIICFEDKLTNDLGVRAFIMFQDEMITADLSGMKSLSLQRYQVSVSEIEEMTGLDFDDQLYDKNPTLFNDNPEARKRLRINNFPERIEVDDLSEIKSAGEEREFVLNPQESPVAIIAAMVNPESSPRDEWVALFNHTTGDINIDGWRIIDLKRREITLSGITSSGEAERIDLKETPVILANTGGTISLFNEKNERVDRVKYTKIEGSKKGKVVRW